MGVKSLWSLLEPVGRPVLLETMEGKSMAIDSSIWIYQFQATMRDKEGRGLLNAHVVGFLRRISKLLFYGIKPVFVFDGGAPALKRNTITERKTKKSGAAESHAKVAEKLLAAQMRREALNHAQASSSKGKAGGPNRPVVIDENTVYLEDLEGPAPKTPAKSPQKEAQASPPSSKKKRWHDHDPYRLPDVNMDDMVAKVTRSNAPDPRLATEDELRAFIEEMRPEDFDVHSPAFRELPTEVQYEIIGDLRLKSRQTSYKRLQNMLRKARTPMDFSKEQIKNLKQRNSLTQQLLVTTDSIGKAHVEIPIRIASERNREYVLIKNEDGSGGWILGIRDEGTRAKPIEIDQDPAPEVQVDDNSDDDMEEVNIPTIAAADPDLRKHRRKEMLSAVSKRYKSSGLAPLTTKADAKISKPLFVSSDSEVEADDDLEDELDPDLIAAMEESLQDQEVRELQQAIEASKTTSSKSTMVADISWSNQGASSSGSRAEGGSSTGSHAAPAVPVEDDSDDDLYASHSRLETALAIAGASPKKQSSTAIADDASFFGTPSLLVSTESIDDPTSGQVSQPNESTASDESDDDMEEVPVPTTPLKVSIPRLSMSRISPEPITDQYTSSTLPTIIDVDEDEDDMLEVPAVPLILQPRPYDIHSSLGPESQHPPQKSFSDVLGSASMMIDGITSDPSSPTLVDRAGAAPSTTLTAGVTARPSINADISTLPAVTNEDLSESDSDAHWSRPASPDPTAVDAPPKVTEESWDAAQEMDPQAEAGEYARFMAQVRGRNLDDVRQEIDDEIKALNQQRKVAMRDSEDITQQMISQIMMMLRLFGIPYITAPMEAEAQCAELLTLGLVDGIITDDSDVFLFGGLRVLKNMFNQSKTVECFLLSDLERELGLDREKLIRLAYLLGSDYTEGLSGVGPVVAMELLAEFPGLDGLRDFREWWRKVQSGKDTAEDTKSKFRKRFKKRFKDLYLPEDWPNPAVRDAYHHPTVDSSEEPFKWGLPDLDALRQFFDAELGWAQEKVDGVLLPIIHKMGKRNETGQVNRQGNLNSFFDVPAGGGAPRKRQAYTSKRLQQVVSEFRKKRAAGTSSSSGNVSEDDYEEDEQERPKKKRKQGEKGTRGRTPARGRGARGRGRGRGGATSKKRKAVDESSSSESEPLADAQEEIPPVLPAPVKPRPRPRPAYKQASADLGGDNV